MVFGFLEMSGLYVGYFCCNFCASLHNCSLILIKKSNKVLFLSTSSNFLIYIDILIKNNIVTEKLFSLGNASFKYFANILLVKFFNLGLFCFMDNSSIL